jgi:hypothetical protein
VSGWASTYRGCYPGHLLEIATRVSFGTISPSGRNCIRCANRQPGQWWMYPPEGISRTTKPCTSYVVVKAVLRALYVQKRDKGDELPSHVYTACNATPHTSTGFSPQRLVDSQCVSSCYQQIYRMATTAGQFHGVTLSMCVSLPEFGSPNG